MRALITGGMGFIGSNLAHKLVSENNEVTIIDSMVPGLGGNDFNIFEIRDNVKVIKKDIRDEKAIDDAVKGKDCIFHLAGQVDHKRSMENPLEDVSLRVNGTISLLEACRKNNQKAKIIFSSTRSVYGEVKKVPANEDMPANPKGMYAITSLAAEKIIGMYSNLYGMNFTILRLVNTYGPRHQMKKDYGIVNHFVRQALDRHPITVMGDGKILRDYIFVGDACDAVIRCAVNSKTDGQVINLGTGKGVSFLELAKLIGRMTGSEVKKVEYSRILKQIEPGDFVADISKLKKLTGWSPKMPLETGLKITMDFYSKNREKYW